MTLSGVLQQELSGMLWNSFVNDKSLLQAPGFSNYDPIKHSLQGLRKRKEEPFLSLACSTCTWICYYWALGEVPELHPSKPSGFTTESLLELSKLEDSCYPMSPLHQ